MKVAILPLDIAYADVDANLRAVEHARPEPDTDLFVLPELFSTGYLKNPEKLKALAARPGGELEMWLRRLAAGRNMAVAGSMVATEGDGRYFNRAFLIEPDGKAHFYDKRHLFSHSGENLVFAAGAGQSPVAEFRGWKIKLMVCYDLRFPTWCRNVDLEYDMLLFPANWPQARRYAFEHLLIARAIENQAVTVGANRGGEDRWGVYPADMSGIYDWFGRPAGEVRDGMVYASLDRSEMDAFRREFPVYLDADVRSR